MESLFLKIRGFFHISTPLLNYVLSYINQLINHIFVKRAVVVLIYFKKLFYAIRVSLFIFDFQNF